MKVYEDGYQGARFFKCDLQMQTPADQAHWRGARMGPSPEEQRAAAESYVRRCYEAGLEVIAITDHNFASKDFIPLLREAIARQMGEHEYELVLLPGFEVQGPIGKGAHLLCIFDPTVSLAEVDARLSLLGLTPDRRFDSAGQPQPVPTANMTFERMLQVVQGDPTFPGICVAAHPNNDGVLDSDTVEQWWSQETIRNEALLCMELPRARSEYVERPGSSLIKSLLLNQDSRYARRTPIATVCSSDCKRLTAGMTELTNFIGFRHTWIKMSLPSIEGLRQAFLDHDSRLRFGDTRPEEAYTYPKIRSLSVAGVEFLADRDLAFSPNLTALIGGRGTGKSTLIEYLRVILAQDAAVQGEDANRNFQKLLPSIGTGKLVARLEKEGQILVVERPAGGKPTVIEGPSAPDLARFFPVRVLSQKEIYAIAEDRSARLRLVDDIVRRELDELGRKETDVANEIRTLNQQLAGLPELRRREAELETERKDLEVKLGRLKTLEEPLERWKGRLAEERFFVDLAQEATEVAGALRGSIETVELRATTIGDELRRAPSAGLVVQVAEAADNLAGRLRADVEKAVASFEADVKTLLARPDVVDWRVELATARSEFEKLRDELKTQGTDPDQYLEYQRGLRERTVQLEDVRKRIAGVEALRIKRDGGTAADGERQPGLSDALRDIWSNQTGCRAKAAAKLTEGVPKTQTGEPFVKLTLAPFGDSQAFKERLRDASRDRRRISQVDWDDCMLAVHAAACASGSAPLSPTAVLGQWVHELRQGQKPPGYPWEPSDRRQQSFLDWLTDETLEELALWRTPDRVTIELFRQDGSRVGDLDERVSVGQRCTAILALLLASGDTPIVIDQPEEDLDNEFVFKELVPLLRQVKERRQVILATHNANIPVNGDAELVAALEVRDGRGHPMRVSGDTALGALDRVAVKRAVEDIMEGSEEAFRRRFEKYGF